jgi:hypothetical protein
MVADLSIALFVAPTVRDARGHGPQADSE